jgi:signal peptidase I
MNNLKPQFRPKLRRPNGFDELIQTIVFVFVVIVLFDMAIPRSLVEGRSMSPTFEGPETWPDSILADRLIVSRVDFLIWQPQRGDIIVFNSVNAGEFARGVMLIKRVIGLPGDHIQFINQELYINGQLVPEPYINEPCTVYQCPDAETFLGENEYFVMGDNRNHSKDSRSFGAVPLDHIVGRVVFRYWPINRIGFIFHQDYEGLDSEP